MTQTENMAQTENMTQTEDMAQTGWRDEETAGYLKYYTY